MITHTAPQDHEKRIVIVSQLERLCVKCGSHAFLRDDVWTCCKCKSTETDEVYEHEAADFREALLLAQEVEKAQRYIDGTMNTQDDFREPADTEAAEIADTLHKWDDETVYPDALRIPRREEFLTIADYLGLAYGVHPLDPRTPEQKDADEFDREVMQTRESDRPI